MSTASLLVNEYFRYFVQSFAVWLLCSVQNFRMNVKNWCKWRLYFRQVIYFVIYFWDLYTEKLHVRWMHYMGLIPVWINNYILHKVWDEITYPLLNFNGAVVEVWEWKSNLIPCFTGYVITYPCWGLKLIRISKRLDWLVTLVSDIRYITTYQYNDTYKTDMILWGISDANMINSLTLGDSAVILK